MQIVKQKEALRRAMHGARQSGHTIGFVPTMGFLHEGHLSLMRRARMENDIVVASIFVNPTQFGPNEDLEAYPRDLRRDQKLMAAEQVDIAYLPCMEHLYPDGYSTYVEVKGAMAKALCGRSRPRHFRGVTTIVAKLFHLVGPHRAYFGQKDAQQLAIVRKMTQDLDFDMEIVACPTIREVDGLALSSRNAYLSSQHRTDAVVLYRSLTDAKELIAQGERQSKAITQGIIERINTVADAVIDYVAMVDAATLEAIETVQGRVLIAVAVKLGRSRLIDNVQIEV